MPTRTTAAIYCRDDDATLDDVEGDLRKLDYAVERDGDRLRVSWTYDDVVHAVRAITKVVGPHVSEAAMRLGNHAYWGHVLEKVDARFEIAIDDLDAALGEINRLIDVELVIRDWTKGFQHTPWNGNFLHDSELR